IQAFYRPKQQMYPPVIKCLLILCLTLVSSGAAARAVEKTSGPEAPAPGQTQFASIVVNGRTLTGPNSAAHRQDGRILVPVVSIARALGDTAAVDAVSRLLT